MRRFHSILCCLSLMFLAQSGLAQSATLHGRVEGDTYYAPGGHYQVQIPVLPELGGTIYDTQNVVVFQDQYSVHVSIGAFPQDPTQRWELSTRGLKDYLTYFFGNFVIPDFRQSVPGIKIESALFEPHKLGGALLAYTLLPGGSMFASQVAPFRGDTPIVAKRGNLVFIRDNIVYVISIELAERVIEGDQYKKTTAQEDAILRHRLDQIADSMTFTIPPTGK